MPALPTLHQLNIFRVAAQHLSFHQAADELYITPSAVSHQIKRFEEVLGFPLFKRLNKAIELTPEGEALLQLANDTLFRLNSGIDKIRRRNEHGVLNISLMPSLASQVVIPHLAEFREDHPDISVAIESGKTNLDFYKDKIDLAIRYGKDEWPGLYTAHFNSLTEAAVCSPAYAEQHNINTLEDINRVTLINIPVAPEYPTQWFIEAGLKNLSPQHTLWFDSYQDCIHAAEQSLGVTLAMLPIENRLLSNKRLVQLFKFTKKHDRDLFMICRPGEETRDDIQAFCRWLKQILRANSHEE